jgi:hypothetical protein
MKQSKMLPSLPKSCVRIAKCLQEVNDAKI